MTGEDEALIAATGPALEAARDAMAAQAVHKALEAIFVVVAQADRYIDAQAPWALRKTDPERMKAVLYTMAEIVRRIALLTQPVMPDASAKLLDLVAVPADSRTFADLDARLEPGTTLPKPEGVFPRYVEPEAEEG